ncbi:MAG: hypothetical protein AAF226_13455, partial [Verrucomicrobiota bacterium]
NEPHQMSLEKLILWSRVCDHWTKAAGMMRELVKVGQQKPFHLRYSSYNCYVGREPQRMHHYRHSGVSEDGMSGSRSGTSRDLQRTGPLGLGIWKSEGIVIVMKTSVMGVGAKGPYFVKALAAKERRGDG